MPTSTPSFIRIVEAAMFFYDRGRLGRGEIVTLREPLGYPLGTLWVGVRAKEGKRGGGWLTRTISSPLREFQRGASECRLGNAAVGYRHAPQSACFSVSRLSAKKKQVVSKEKVVPLKVMYRILSSKRNDIDILSVLYRENTKFFHRRD